MTPLFKPINRPISAHLCRPQKAAAGRCKMSNFVDESGHQLVYVQGRASLQARVMHAARGELALNRTEARSTAVDSGFEGGVLSPTGEFTADKTSPACFRKKYRDLENYRAAIPLEAKKTREFCP
jgi:hypothetical protein